MYVSDKLSDAVAKYLGAEVKTKLGSGHFGSAYLLTNGKVMKITDDAEEYATALTLKDKQYRHIIKIFDAYKMATEREEFYVVIREYLELADKLSDFELITDFEYSIRGYFDGYRSDKSIRERSAKLKGRFPALADLIDQYFGVMEDCMRAGFKRLDIKWQNMGLKNGVLQLIDTGFSGNRLEKDVEPVKLELEYA